MAAECSTARPLTPRIECHGAGFGQRLSTFLFWDLIRFTFPMQPHFPPKTLNPGPRMPRLGRQLLRHAHSIDPLLPPLLRPCRDLASARNELRWLREHVEDECSRHAKGPGSLSREGRISFNGKEGGSSRRSQLLLRQLCRRRSRGEPLQYILGTQPFGELEIICRPKVLIPRPDTESYTTYLAQRILADLGRNSSSINNTNLQSTLFPSLQANDRSHASPLRVLDLCTGTGCIALLLHQLLSQELKKGGLRIRGVDISPHAVSLARANLEHNVAGGVLSRSALDEVEFMQDDVFRLGNEKGKEKNDGAGVKSWDVLVSNPPYISRESFYHRTERSVRLFEPRLALVPEAVVADPALGSQSDEHDDVAGSGSERVDLTGDVFYSRILAVGERAGAKLAVMEVEDENQAMRVLRGSEADNGPQRYWRPHALWRDNIGAIAPLHSENAQTLSGITDLGTGDARAVVFIKDVRG